MLSDQERATLHEIQCQLLADDPQFAQIFEGRGQRRPVLRASWVRDEQNPTRLICVWRPVLSALPIRPVPGAAETRARSSDQDQRTYAVLQWISVILGVVMLLAGAPVGALLFAATALAFFLSRRGDAASPRF